MENFFEEQLAKWLPSFANKNHNNNSNNALLSNPLTNGGGGGGNHSNNASTSASPAPGAPSPSLDNSGRKSVNSVIHTMNTNSNGSNASSLHRSGDDNTEDGCNPAKRQRKQTE